MPVDAYMRACLTDPEHGYYRRRQAIGAAADFITAPEISQIFGELIGIWVAASWQALGEPVRWRLIELGPGRGTLMADMLRAMTVLPRARAGIEVVLVEVNQQLREQQRAKLVDCGVGVTWREGFSTQLEPLPTIVIANEFLDALPIRQLVAKDGHWHERMVTLAPDSVGSESLRLSFGLGAAPVAPAEGAPDGATREIMSGAQAYLHNLAASLAAAPQIHLYVDYGHVGPVLGDTLQAVTAHHYSDPLEAPGEHDLSAQVDFAQIAAVARANRMNSCGPLVQAELLGRLGAAQRLERLAHGKDARTLHQLQTGLARLMDPSGMGGRFKALALASEGLAAPPVF